MLNVLVPGPLHSLFLCAVGTYLFTVVLRILNGRDVDAAKLLGYGWGRDKLLHDARQMNLLLWTVYGGSMLASLLRVSTPLVVSSAWGIVLFVLFLVPGESMGGSLRNTFRAALLRTVNPLNYRAPTLLSEIVVGDILTSYAKVLAEWDALLFCFLLIGSTPSGPCLPSLLSVFLVCYPFYCRLRQCLSDWMVEPRQWRPFLNALKYATSFPLIYVSYLLVNPQSDPAWRSIWLTLVSLNTVYGIIWDLIVDWDLFKFDAGPRLRTAQLFSDRRRVYYAAVLVNVACRASWTLKFILSAYPSNKAGHFLDSKDGLLVLQLIEIFRRFIWLIFRLEVAHFAH